MSAAGAHWATEGEEPGVLGSRDGGRAHWATEGEEAGAEGVFGSRGGEGDRLTASGIGQPLEGAVSTNSAEDRRPTSRTASSGEGERRVKTGEPTKQIEGYVTHSLEIVVGHTNNYTIEGRGSQPLHDGALAIIPETQFTSYGKEEGKVKRGSAYKAILASVRLDSPTSSQETWCGERNQPNQELVNYLMNTPIRKSAASAVALGQHRLSPKQGMIWKSKGISPLGRKQAFSKNPLSLPFQAEARGGGTNRQAEGG